MGIIRASKLGYEYLKYDDDGNVEQTSRAVDDVNLDIREGQFIAILGHNGSGKSTLAKHINALLVPTEGTLWVDSMTPPLRRTSGRSGREREWFFKIPTIRSLGVWWRRM